MSRQLISRSPDLQRLEKDGYDFEIRNGHLVVRHVPYVRAAGQVGYGTLVSRLDLEGADRTGRPGDHVIFFAGDHPCRVDGSKLSIVNQSSPQEIVPGLVVNHSFSQKPKEGYDDYYHKVTSYVAMLEPHAQSIDPTATARTYPVIRPADEDDVFRYIDNAAGRSGIAAIANRLKLQRVAIVGLGGSGSYVLDLVAKTPVREIHLYDGDRFLQHNAFRSPGAPSFEDLDRGLNKVDWLASIYGKMRKGIVPHAVPVSSHNVSDLEAMDFVFVCIDHGPSRRLIVEHLRSHGRSFVDVGMGLFVNQGTIDGLVRTTVGTPAKSDHLAKRLTYVDAADNEYATNVQIADLNALNAAMAVIKWKRLFKFYVADDGEHSATFSLNGNFILNEDPP